MNIETIRVKNFKALRDVEIKNVPPYCVFVGRNGTGKTTLFRVFAFLKNCLAKNVRAALNIEGGRNGLREVLSRGHDKENLEIEIQFRLDIAGTNRLVTYRVEIGAGPDGGAIVKREILRYKRGRHGSPFHFIDFTNGEGYAINNEEEFDKPDSELTRESQKLDSAETLAIKGLGQFERFKAASAFRQLIENWHISDFHINSARGDKEEEDAEHLSPSGDNLPSMARYLYEKHRTVFDSIRGRMQQRVPGVSDIAVTVTEDGRLLMRYRDGAFVDPFIDKNVSDGTICKRRTVKRAFTGQRIFQPCVSLFKAGIYLVICGIRDSLTASRCRLYEWPHYIHDGRAFHGADPPQSSAKGLPGIP